MNTSKQMMYDDLFFAPAMCVVGVIAITKGHAVMGSILILFGALWLASRIYHLFHPEEVFGDPENKNNDDLR